ncbi:uncharacterized protein LOC108672609 [Hyalella azteca]|uniref:Uncharacterized protein LOC108672609 n=1 Tax=Hyalella azteca TaxID=294128 RepID=A0A8B7NQ09_HYAAZ|nr:uncharacterized protein LOC108672609 [Hyalella azteca]
MIWRMGCGMRHLLTASLLMLLLLLFYLSLSAGPLLSNPLQIPKIMNTQYGPPPTEENSLAALSSVPGSATSPVTIDLLRRYFLLPPSEAPYNLDNANEQNPSMGQAQVIDRILKEQRGGFFVECGGLDGELRSNTLFFERFRGWKGLVIEADPVNFAQMKTKNRKAYISPSCLSTTSNPEKVVFAQNSNRGHIYDVESYDDAPAKGLVNVQCFPFISYMKALNVTTVDYFSLDVEGAEYKVLQSIPWDDVDIKTLSVEYLHDVEGKAAIRKLLLANGYSVFTEVSAAFNLANDFIFVKNNLLSEDPSR